MWNLFVDNFERFTGVLCAAARYGVTPESEQDYLALRTWFLDNYHEHAPRLRMYMSPDIFSLALEGGHVTQSRKMDGFEAIFLPLTLSELLEYDNGRLIHLISHVSQAVYAVEM